MRRLLDARCLLVLVILASLTLVGSLGAFELVLPSEEYRWIKVETANFSVFSNADEAIARPVAESFEQLWQVLVQHFDVLPVASPVPTSVFVFDFFTDAFLPYGPLRKGKPEASGGAFFSGRSADYIAVVERDYRFPDHMDIYHDYVHSVLEAFVPELPLWLQEGLAEYYSVFDIEEGEVHVGYRVNRHIGWLRNKRLIPFAELFAIDRASPEYDEAERTGIFYAESWLLTHMLVTERENGRAEIAAYAGLLRQGVGQDAAFTTAFGTTYEELEAELRRYIRSRSHHYLVFPVSREIVSSTRVSELSRPELLFRLGDLLGSGMGERFDFAAEHFEAALEIDRSYGPAVAGLGLLDEHTGRHETALRRYEKAAELAPDDDRINFLLGRALARSVDRDESSTERIEQMQRARAALRRATELRPELVEPWAELGSTYLSDLDNPEPGISALERAMELQPKRPDIGVRLTALYARCGLRAEAESVIARMRSAGVDAQGIRSAMEAAAKIDPEPEAVGE
jgi:tetratricopeptide (TPR) repeat protein